VGEDNLDGKHGTNVGGVPVRQNERRVHLALRRDELMVYIVVQYCFLGYMVRFGQTMDKKKNTEPRKK
jgi:hypothetical protein